MIILAIVVASMVLVPVYAEQNVTNPLSLKMGIGAIQAEQKFKEVNEVLESCAIMSTVGFVTDKCVTFVIDLRDSLREVMDKFENYNGTTEVEIQEYKHKY